jgi:hypothetical protein
MPIAPNDSQIYFSYHSERDALVPQSFRLTRTNWDVWRHDFEEEESDLLLGIDDLPQIPVVLSEWTDYNPKCTSNVAQCFGLVCNQKTTKVMPKRFMLVI